VSRRKGKRVKYTFVTLTKQAYQAIGGRFDAHLAAQCAYYPRIAFNKLVCEGCSLREPKSSCKRAHILLDTNLKRCELCYEMDDEVVLVEHHTLHPTCLEKVLKACEASERSEDVRRTKEGV
jgi:hypothetical protein